MNSLQTFKASTMTEALGQVKQTMGHDAVILHTRTYTLRSCLGLRKREIIEVTAGRSNGQKPPAAMQMKQPVFASAQPAAPLVNPAANVQSLLQSPVAGNALMVNITNEVATLKAMMKDLTHQVRREKNPDVPAELYDCYVQLTTNQVTEDVACEIVQSLARQLRPEQFTQVELVQEKLAEQIDRLISTSGPISRNGSTSPQIVALIGPTGVGKTTTIAKLAANLILREKRRVGLITLDTYRIAAIDQLRKYADIIGAPLNVVASPDELREAIRSMRELDFVLIDTAGRSPNDAMKLHELKQFMSIAEPHEVHLVLSTTASQECVELALTKFSNVRVDKLIFTKLDEAAHAGVVLNVLRKVNKPLSYVTTGQDVPDDIEVGNGRRLAQRILGNCL
jgi:flagellar biosynthesis protein FlhF